MKNIKKHLILWLLVLATLSCTDNRRTKEISILFIGNSYTYYNSSPEIVKAFIQERYPEAKVKTKLISQGGMTLAGHWQNESTIEEIESKEWDYVVLQEQSKLGMPVMIDQDVYFGETDLFYEYARKFDTKIKEANAKTVLLMTWSQRAKPEEQDILSYAYANIANELDAIVVPVGLVWDRLRTNPKIDLYVNDGSHPSEMGSYLLATTLFSTLMNENPEGLSDSIVGYRLSSNGTPDQEEQLLMKLSLESAQLIQSASWEVVSAIQNSNGLLEIEKPNPSFEVPTFSGGESFKLNDIIGQWYGTSAYGFNYEGQIMEIENANGKPYVSLSFYSAHAKDELEVKSAAIENNQLVINLVDSFRQLHPTLRISVLNGEMRGFLESDGNIHMYKHIKFSKEQIHNDIDLEKLAVLIQSFETSIEKQGYLPAAIQHYEQYSELIRQDYQPEEEYLNAVGYNFLRDKKVDDALNIFKLAMSYYPESVNTYDSYAEALLAAGRKEDALEIYTKAYELAKNTDYNNIAYIETNLNKLKNDIPVTLDGAGVPPPPPPQ